MVNHLTRTSAFEGDMNVSFIADFTRRLEGLYKSTHRECEDLPKDYQRYLRPHVLRTQAELALLSAASLHKARACVRPNTRKDVHALVLDGPYAITLSRSQSPKAPPRPAKFRAAYALYCAQGQFPLPGTHFSTGQEIIEVSDQTHPTYVLITHEPEKNDWSKVGFVYANIVVPSGKGFRLLGSGIDLLARYGSEKESFIEDVPEPNVEVIKFDRTERRTGTDS